MLRVQPRRPSRRIGGNAIPSSRRSRSPARPPGRRCMRIDRVPSDEARAVQRPLASPPRAARGIDRRALPRRSCDRPTVAGPGAMLRHAAREAMRRVGCQPDPKSHPASRAVRLEEAWADRSAATRAGQGLVAGRHGRIGVLLSDECAGARSPWVGRPCCVGAPCRRGGVGRRSARAHRSSAPPVEPGSEVEVSVGRLSRYSSRARTS